MCIRDRSDRGHSVGSSRPRASSRACSVVSAHLRGGLRLRPAVTDQEEAAASADHRRRQPLRDPDAAGIWHANETVRQAERELARQAEVAYARTVSDWHAAQANELGASATPGRASNKPSKGKAARQTTSP